MHRGGSIGNFVFTGARLFFNSLEAAIFWFSNLSAIPPSSRVIPVLNVNTRVTIGASLVDKTQIIGQDNISHPPDIMHDAVITGGNSSTTNIGIRSNGNAEMRESSADTGTQISFTSQTIIANYFNVRLYV